MYIQHGIYKSSAGYINPARYIYIYPARDLYTHHRIYVSSQRYIYIYPARDLYIQHRIYTKLVRDLYILHGIYHLWSQNIVMCYPHACDHVTCCSTATYWLMLRRVSQYGWITFIWDGEYRRSVECHWCTTNAYGNIKQFSGQGK